jgi:diguanylate cyclase (GGDEF)-like protein
MEPTDAPAQAYEALVQFLYQAPIGLVQATRDGQVTMINPMSAQLLMPLAPAGNLDNLFEVLAPVAPQLRQLAAGPHPPGAVICEDLRVTLPDAAARDGLPVTLSIKLLQLDTQSLMASITDITLAVAQEQQHLARHLHDATRVDRLTAMPNRSVVVERIAAALQRARADADYQFAVMFINADRFARINLTLGQAGGDELLQLMAGRLNSTVRQRDAILRASGPEHTAARVGGDEFVIVLEGLRSAEAVCGVAQRLVETLAKPYAIGATPVYSAASLGVVTREHAGADADAVLQDASLAMREAKRAGGARYRVFDPQMKARARRRGNLEDELRRGLEAGELFVVYQPIVPLDGGGAPGVEALVRWRHPERGTVSPLEFIGIAEETGLIVPLGRFVLDSACRQLRDWQRELGARAPAVLSVNLSRAQLLDATISAQIRQALQDSGVPATCLQLEVTESLAAQDEHIQARLHELKALGLTLALDDFGTGYSSLACLHQLPIDVVKIDRSFVSQVETSEHHRVLIEATVRVVRSLGLRTVAEGIETAGQAALLSALQCDKGQGYFWSRPLPAEAATRWLAQYRSSHSAGLASAA